MLAVRGEAAPPSREGSILKDRLGERCQSEVYLRPIELDADIQQQLVTELTPLTGEGFLRKDKCAQDLIDDVAHHVLDCDRLTVIRQDDELVAFVAASIVEHNGDIFYHLEGIIVHPDYHGAGLSVDALRKDIAATQADYLAFHTQSSRMLGLGNELADNNHVDSVQFAGLIGTRHQDGIVDK